jgi:HrpA-like RNA helicase
VLIFQAVPVSRAAAWQRTGRAGRERPGKCYRLYPEAAFFSLPPETVPEIKRVPAPHRSFFFFFRKLILDVQIGLAGVVLQLKALGVRELSEFEFLERPSVAALKRAVELLLRLGALSPRGDLTPLGKDMVPARSLFVCVESARRSSALQYPA